MNRKSRRAARTSGGSPVETKPAVDPAFIAAFLERGWALRAEGRDEEAMEIARSVIRDQETNETRELFVECVKDWTYFPGAEELRDVLARALRETWAKTGVLRGIVMGTLERSPAFGPAMRRATAAWPRRLPLDELLGPGSLAAIAGDDLLIALLESERIVGIDAERFFTSLRAGLLDIATRGRSRADDDVVQLACALAQQCCINDYVYDQTVDEADIAAKLRDRLRAAFAARAPVAPIELAVSAAYCRLDGLPANAVRKRSWPKGFTGLLEQQIERPAAERRYRDAIPRITPIADATSLKVQEQYEENPFPRWASVPAFVRPAPVDQWFQQNFPMAGYRAMGKTSGLDVLIAGCGTGQHSVFFAQSYPGAKILAVDLSLASLCYAKERSQALGFGNIEYAQADILELGSLGRTFDVISSGGVLHHLADMEQGWRTLLSLLRPGGCMNVALYSELARRDVVAAQQWLAQRGFTASADDIRRGRQELAAAAASETSLKAALEFVDFYATSDCRDLLFHVQEHRCTIPQIAQFLENNDLEFLGFKIADKTLRQFRAHFSSQQEADLMCWHEFEIQNPDTFRTMYEFWVQKRAGGP